MLKIQAVAFFIAEMVGASVGASVGVVVYPSPTPALRKKFFGVPKPYPPVKKKFVPKPYQAYVCTLA